jgi:hypothetical protein
MSNANPIAAIEQTSQPVKDSLPEGVVPEVGVGCAAMQGLPRRRPARNNEPCRSGPQAYRRRRRGGNVAR